MVKYLIILLDDTSVSFCHYDNSFKERNLIPIEKLKEGILFAMKENLSIQYVLPNYSLPKEYIELMECIDNVKIVPSEIKTLNETDIVVLNNWESNYPFERDRTYVLRITKEDLKKNQEEIKNSLKDIYRLNIVITNINNFYNSDFEDYKTILDSFSEEIKSLMRSKNNISQLNILTDRLTLDSMNNCNAGYENITLAPDGKFYICPAFYHTNKCESIFKKDDFCIGDLKKGVDIKNPQLYKIDYAPLCRNCDAYQCKRCIWLNVNSTCEINTPSHEQCVIAHLERNASRTLLNDIRNYGEFIPDKEIKEIDYLDPFDVKNEW